MLIEVNISGEASKTGAAPAALPALADALRACPHLAPRGLMAIAAPGLTEAATAPPVRRGARAARPAGGGRTRTSAWPELSMGMSDDFEAAILEGATIVRLGRALFGARA